MIVDRTIAIELTPTLTSTTLVWTVDKTQDEANGLIVSHQDAACLENETRT